MNLNLVKIKTKIILRIHNLSQIQSSMRIKNLITMNINQDIRKRKYMKDLRIVWDLKRKNLLILLILIKDRLIRIMMSVKKIIKMIVKTTRIIINKTIKIIIDKTMKVIKTITIIIVITKIMKRNFKKIKEIIIEISKIIRYDKTKN